jgi:NADPH2:quinone reductase
MKALYFEHFGGPEVLRYGDVADAESAEGFALVKTSAIGLNFADLYRRRGNYHLAGHPPYIAGYEAAGTISGTGQRVAFADSPFANAELVAVPADKLIPLPDDISDETAAALLLQGLTAQYLIRDSYRVRAGEVAVVHAAAGGVGLLLVQLLKHAGAHVIAFASTKEKCDAALSYGAHEAYTYEDWPQRARGANVIYDSIGVTLDASIDAVKVGGTVVFYGMAGGDPKPVNPRVLMDGSKTLTGGDLWNVLTSHDERVRRASELFDLVRTGALCVPIAARFPLRDGARAHEFLESRSAIGKVLLIPD